MSETINFEQAVLENLRQLPTEKQQEVLDFAQFLVQKAEQTKQLPSESSESNISSTIEPSVKLSLRQIASLPIAERHKILAPYMAATAEDFLTYPELTEFSVLDAEDWETEYDCQPKTRRGLAGTTRSNPRARNSKNTSCGCD
ncbi:DUF2281 domain-containing protein [Microcoleus sp. F4-D5]|uniref:DUF2281 domain-containing protein n=1 Tax=Microcoleus sp. F4-D5 TaxID=2818760 RepID=UPI002FD48618